MMKRKVLIGFLMLSLCLLVSCWQEQHHDYFPSEEPNYPLKGQVLNSADGTPLSGALVFLNSEIDTTDSTGTYIFPHVLGNPNGYDYTITITKDFFVTYSTGISVFASSEIDTIRVESVSLGKIYYAEDIYNPGMWGSFSPQGVVWLGSNLWSADSMDKVIFAHNYDSYMSVVDTFFLPNFPTPKGNFYIAPLGLEWHQNYLITFDDRKDTFYELILTPGDTALIKTSFKLPSDVTSTGDIWDITWDGRHLWSCSPGSYDYFHTLSRNPDNDVIHRHSGNLSVAETFPTQEIDDGIVNPTGIAWDGEKFWLNSRGTHRLYMLDENLHVLGYYVYEELIRPHAPYQICWGNGYLWGCFRDSWEGINSVGGPTQYIYKFGRLYP